MANPIKSHVSQRGTRTFDVYRNFDVLVPPEIADHPELLRHWISQQESDGDEVAYWSHGGNCRIAAGPLVIKDKHKSAETGRRRPTGNL